MVYLLTALILFITSAHAQIVSTQAGPPSRPVTTVAGLPACGAALKGNIYFVTDALSPSALAVVAAGGAVQVGVTCNGTSWIVE